VKPEPEPEPAGEILTYGQRVFQQFSEVPGDVAHPGPTQGQGLHASSPKAVSDPPKQEGVDGGINPEKELRFGG
jgi:hypothetical protein